MGAAGVDLEEPARNALLELGGDEGGSARESFEAAGADLEEPARNAPSELEGDEGGSARQRPTWVGSVGNAPSIPDPRVQNPAKTTG